MIKRHTPESFWANTAYTGDCIVWCGYTNDDGYGRIRFGFYDLPTRLIMVHRLAWTLLRGPIPDGMEIDHICHTRPCVNIGHLQCIPGTIHTATGNATRYKIICKYGHLIGGDIGKLYGCGRCEREGPKHDWSKT